MIRGLYAAARGMAVEQVKQNVISNNLANSNTTGYKKDTVLVRSFSEELVARLGRSQVMPLGGMQQSPLVHTVETVFSPGILENTGRALDLALMGDAFFTLQTPQGVRYTRDGSFGLDANGFLVSSDGYFVLNTEGLPIQLRTDNVTVDQDGGLWRSDGEERTFAGRLGLAVFAADDMQSLEKRGHNLFEAVGAAPAMQGAGQVRQGILEGANLDTIREMIDMLSVMRTYEANQKALQAHDEILGKSVNDVGRLR